VPNSTNVSERIAAPRPVRGDCANGDSNTMNATFNTLAYWVSVTNATHGLLSLPTDFEWRPPRNLHPPPSTLSHCLYIDSRRQWTVQQQSINNLSEAPDMNVQNDQISTSVVC